VRIIAVGVVTCTVWCSNRDEGKRSSLLRSSGGIDHPPPPHYAPGLEKEQSIFFTLFLSPGGF